MTTAKLIYDTSANADLYYITRFSCTDAFLYLEVKGKHYVILNALEFDRAKRTAKVDEVLPREKYSDLAAKQGRSGAAAYTLEVLKEFGVSECIVPHNTPLAFADKLRAYGMSVKLGDDPFAMARTCKTAEEKKLMLAAQKVTFRAIKLVETTLKQSKIKNKKIIFNGKALTSELLRSKVMIFLLEKGYECEDAPIIAGGKQGCDPHERGSGLLKAHESIIVDVFPRGSKARYFGDATRTFCKGKAPEALKKMYAIVKQAQETAIKQVKAGVNGKTIHQQVKDFFTTQGYPTGPNRGRNEGFIHGTGHSLGLEIHEEPFRINSSDCIIKAGNMLTVEPGLYYQDIGAVRIEDIVYVTQTGNKVLAGYPKKLEIA